MSIAHYPYARTVAASNDRYTCLHSEHTRRRTHFDAFIIKKEAERIRRVRIAGGWWGQGWAEQPFPPICLQTKRHRGALGGAPRIEMQTGVISGQAKQSLTVTHIHTNITHKAADCSSRDHARPDRRKSGRRKVFYGRA